MEPWMHITAYVGLFIQMMCLAINVYYLVKIRKIHKRSAKVYKMYNYNVKEHKDCYNCKYRDADKFICTYPGEECGYEKIEK